MKTVNVTIWSDFVCPWCWIAKRRFDHAVAALEGEVEVVVTTKAYRLAKGTTPINYIRAVHAKFGNPVAADGMMTAVAENGRQEGLVYNFPTMRFGDTSDAHALLKSIADTGLRERVSERLYRAATTDGLDIFDREMLLALAAEAGATNLVVDFDSPRIAGGIARDEAEANAVSNGVPLFVFNDRFYVSGAQPAAAFEKALRHAAIDKPAQPPVGDGAVCSVDGCDA
ncbi:DsbA family oxidoreductase [Novosphingobium sp. Chol11]|uniref:DsbA family oxidoreductase n=1 Tax=Novosphingobium sp. Chol11 TaxID=1385763 RepID=UPI000BE30586|nr:DsbA family oxidoreductase [Novosphingobium sp. Chol11]